MGGRGAGFSIECVENTKKNIWKLQRDKERIRKRMKFLSVPERNECCFVSWTQNISEVLGVT